MYARCDDLEQYYIATILHSLYCTLVANRPGMAGIVAEIWALSRRCPGGVPARQNSNDVPEFTGSQCFHSLR